MIVIRGAPFVRYGTSVCHSARVNAAKSFSPHNQITNASALTRACSTQHQAKPKPTPHDAKTCIDLGSSNAAALDRPRPTGPHILQQLLDV